MKVDAVNVGTLDEVFQSLLSVIRCDGVDVDEIATVIDYIVFLEGRCGVKGGIGDATKAYMSSLKGDDKT